MNTSKPISSISYNSADFLRSRLEEYRRAGLFSFWCFILHLGEGDECGDKDHFHVYAEPSKRIQTDSIDTSELDPFNPDKPLKCISWRSSKFPDWFLYVLHDTGYLSQKGLVKKYHYDVGAFVSSSTEDFIYLSRSVDRLSMSPYHSMLDAIERGYTWQEYVRRGCIPIQLLRQYQIAWDILQNAGNLVPEIDVDIKPEDFNRKGVY